MVGTGWKGNQAFPRCPSPSWSWQPSVCARLRARLGACSELRPPSAALTRPSLLAVTTAALDGMGQPLDQASYGAKKSTLSALFGGCYFSGITLGGRALQSLYRISTELEIELQIKQGSAHDLQPGLSRCLKQRFGSSMGKRRM